MKLSGINTLWHPIIQDECNAINKEKYIQDLIDECYEID